MNRQGLALKLSEENLTNALNLNLGKMCLKFELKHSPAGLKLVLQHLTERLFKNQSNINLHEQTRVGSKAL
jgi:hypothetical protein